MAVDGVRGAFAVAADAGEGPSAAPARPGPRPRWLPTAAFALFGAVLFAAYFAKAREFGVASDGSSNALQAWSMLHGNPLLRGWTVSDVSFYTTELPEYAFIELVRGLGPDVIYIGAALTYTLVALFAMLLAKGRATGREGLIRAAIAGGILLVPTWSGLLSNPDHTGTQVPVLALWLLLDRARPRWWVPVAAGVLLAWVQAADMLGVYEGVLPVAVVCVVRIYRQRVFPHGGAAVSQAPAGVGGWAVLLREHWYEASLATAAVVSVDVSELALKVIQRAGGFTVLAPTPSFNSVEAVAAHVGVTAESVLLLFSADFSDKSLHASLFSLLHLVGLALAVGAFCLASRRFLSQDMVVQGQVVSIVVLLLAYTFALNPTVGGGAHEIIGVLTGGAVVAGRLLAPVLSRARLLTALALVLAVSAGVYAQQVAQPPQPSAYMRIGAWLHAHHLSYGLADYWDGNVVTVATGGQVQVRPISMKSGRIVISPWESDDAWYAPTAGDASFFIADISRYSACGNAARSRTAWMASIRATFGSPARSYRVDGFDVLVWNHNLLGEHIADIRPGRPSEC
jgi:hypothetical protein